MSRITLFDKYGYFIGDIRASTVRSWVLNVDPNPGECRFLVSRFDTKCTVKNLNFGNYVLVRHASLPDWIGIIVKYKWGNGFVEVTAVQAEYILRKRNTPVQDVEGVSGSLFQQILQSTNGEPFNDKPVYPSSIYYAAPERSQKLGTDALTLAQDLAKRAGNDFDVMYAFDENRRLYLTGNWYKQRGSQINKTLREGKNVQVSGGVLEEDIRTAFNYLEGRADASTTGTRVNSFAWDETSINNFGLFQASSVFYGNKEQITVNENTLNLLKKSKNPFRVYDITALNVSDIFYYLDTGNVLNIDLNTAGFGSSGGFGTQDIVKIVGMEYDDDMDACRLILEIYESETQ